MRDTFAVFCKGAAGLVPTPLATGFGFGEGPRWFEGLLWFSDLLGEAVHTSDMHGSLTTLQLPGHSPSGLGFRPDGSLLIASAEDRLVLRYDGETVVTVADLTDLAPANLGDMVIDDVGRAYIGSQAFSGGVIVRVDPDDSAQIVATDLAFPNGMVINSDRDTLIVAESMARRLSTVRANHRGRRRDRPHRYGRSCRGRLRTGRSRTPHAVPAVKHGGISRTTDRHPTCPAGCRDGCHPGGGPTLTSNPDTQRCEP
ncbi:Gluconolactonase [Mycobacterium basiliense]|uniref:Gluconolactonase n=1 Tax=Mycobacterium basiliense TaxID=2094119 RepID=A0A3S4DQI6_9MYCO|nr:Gluconolactonase [Mycobacterium basiliense]